jgi:hypothetical protein
MTRIPRTLNIGSEERAALEDLSKMEGRPVNELLNEAMKHYLGWRGLRCEIQKIIPFQPCEPIGSKPPIQ